jgi:DNA invertase Pin-like site-specific DNA recombinase
MREIRKIEPKPTGPVQRRRVAAYARVSSGKDAMLHSLSAQVSYYNDYIGSRGDWEFAGIYADEPLTGTKDARPEFQRMLEDCRAGKIDMVLTKSITRFARNTVTLLEAARELKLLGVDIFFEKENVHTLSADGEFVLTILASYAQEESRSASENCRWRIQKMFEQGRPNTGRMLGYRLFEGKLYIIPEEAETVKRIFADYLSGMGLEAMMKKLNADGIRTVFGKAWGVSTLRSLLRNEKYAGDMLLQKTYRLDHISKKRMQNRGERTMYNVVNSHEAIIPKDMFAAVQDEIRHRAAKYQKVPQPKTLTPFTGLIRCGHCKAHYRRKINNAGSAYAKAVWICNTFNVHGKNACQSRQIPEDILTAKTLEALGAAELNGDELRRKISEIQVPEHGRLVYVFNDGHVVIADWQNPSRRESWTPEMKEAARKRQLAINEGRH